MTPRQIKLRVWDGERMWQPHEAAFRLTLTGEVETCDTPAEIIYGRPHIPLQFTGLHDMKGTEVYDGDIVRVGVGVIRADWPPKYKWIEWDDSCGSFLICQKGDGPYDRQQFWPGNEKNLGACVVAGNVYQNPELIA